MKTLLEAPAAAMDADVAARDIPTPLPLITATKPRRWRTIRWSLLRWALAAVAAAMLYRLGRSAWVEILHALRVLVTREAHLVVFIIGLQAIWTVALSRLSRSAVLAVGGSVTRRDALRISMAGFTLSRVIPGGGAAGGVFATRELVVLGNPLALAVSAMIVSWAVATASLGSLVLAGTSAAAIVDDVALGLLLPSASTLAVLVAVGVGATWLVGSARLRAAVVARLESLVRRWPAATRLRSVTASLADMPGAALARRHLAGAAGWSLLAWTADALALWLVFAAFGHGLTLTQLVVGYTFANLLNSTPELTPGWIGVFEATMAATYTTLGVPTGVALIAVLAYRLVSFWMPVAAGVLPAIASLGSRRATGLAETRNPAAAHHRR